MSDVAQEFPRNEPVPPLVGTFRSEALEGDFWGNSLNANRLAFLKAETLTECPRPPRVYIAPRAVVSRLDSFSEYSGTHSYDHYLTEGPESEGSEEVTLPRVRIAGSPRAFVYSRAVGSSSPRAFVSTRAVGSSSPGLAGVVDTAVPFESVKEAVSKFGGITDWKAHRIQTLERLKIVEQDLDKLQVGIAMYHKQAEAAEDAKQQSLDELETTRRLLEELKLDLDKAQTEEQQARQDSELAKLRAEEMEQGIEENASFAAKAQLEVAIARHSASVCELKSVMDEIESVREGFRDLTIEKDLAVKKSEGVFLESKKSERKKEELMVELVATKEMLESAHADFLASQEKKFNLAMARDRDIYDWDKELKTVEGEIERLSREISAENDVKDRLDGASAVLLDLMAELAAYTESESHGGVVAVEFTKGHKDIEAAVASAMEELKEIRLNAEKGNAEVEHLKAVASSLEFKIEEERFLLAEIKNRECKSSVRDEDKDEMMEITLKLKEATEEAKEAKMLAEIAHKELRNAEEEAGKAESRLTTLESKVVAGRKEIEASRASEKLAMAATKLIRESQTEVERAENVRSNSPRSKMMSLEEYYELNRRAQDVEAEAKARAAEAVLKIAGAKENEMKSLGRLAEVKKEMSRRKEELKTAMKKAERAKEGKLGIERELRKVKANKDPLGKTEVQTWDSDLLKADIYGRGDSSKVYGWRDSNAGCFVPASEGKPEKKKKKKLSSVAKAFMLLSKKK